METNFFKNIGALMQGTDINLIIKKNDEQMTVALFANPTAEDKSKDSIPSLNFHATADELDQHFFEQVSQPLNRVSNYSIDVKAFEEDMAKVESSTRKANGSSTKKSEDKTAKQLDKARQLMSSKKPRQAIAVLQEILKKDKEHKEASRLFKEARTAAGLGDDLFSSTTARSTDNPDTDSVIKSATSDNEVEEDDLSF